MTPRRYCIVCRPGARARSSFDRGYSPFKCAHVARVTGGIQERGLTEGLPCSELAALFRGGVLVVVRKKLIAQVLSVYSVSRAGSAAR